MKGDSGRSNIDPTRLVQNLQMSNCCQFLPIFANIAKEGTDFPSATAGDFLIGPYPKIPTLALLMLVAWTSTTEVIQIRSDQKNQRTSRVHVYTDIGASCHIR
jgi:hypothetical protein